MIKSNLRLVEYNEQNNSATYKKGWWDGLHRVKGVTAGERSADELRALLFIFENTTKALEAKLKRIKPKLEIV